MAAGSKLSPERRRRICVVTHAVREDGVTDGASMPGEIAKLFAQDGDDVTLLWVAGREAPSPEEVATQREALKTASVALEVLDRSDQLLPALATPESRSAALLHYLERSGHDLVLAPLEGGLPYYTLLAAETGAFAAPPVVVFASAPEEWGHEADKAFMGSTEAIATSYMEKYCAEMADRTVCASNALRKWMLSKGWRVRKATVLRPPDRSKQVLRPAATSGTRELVALAGWRFRDGLTLLCDALDILAPSAPEGLIVTAFGPFG